MSAARVYDSDIREDNEDAMRNLAASIALAYIGNWESMIGWQRHCEAARPLGKKDVRAILNMSLSDSNQMHWHTQIRAHLREVKPQAFAEAPKLRIVRDEPKPQRKWVVDVTATFKADLFRPNHTLGKIHIVDHARTFVRWSIPSRRDPLGRYIERHEDDPKTPNLIVFGWCGKRYDDVLIPDDLQPGDDAICTKCCKTRDEIGKPPSQTRKRL